MPSPYITRGAIFLNQKFRYYSLFLIEARMSTIDFDGLHQSLILLRSHNRIKMSVSFPFIAVLTIISYFITPCNGFTHYTRHAPTTGIIPGGIYNNGFHSAMDKVVVVSRNCNQRYKCDRSFCNYNFNPYQPNQGSCPTSLFSSAALVAKTGLDLEAVLYMALLALQFGTQPGKY